VRLLEKVHRYIGTLLLLHDFYGTRRTEVLQAQPLASEVPTCDFESDEVVLVKICWYSTPNR
jgi:hypothetical protein